MELSAYIASWRDKTLTLSLAKRANETAEKYQISGLNAHRTPEQARDFALHARENGFGAMIAAAGLLAVIHRIISR